MKTLPPCDHDECPPTRCLQTANAKGVGFSELLEDVERALMKINEAEGYFLLGKIASGKNMLGDGKAILEKVVERWPTSSNAPGERPADKPTI